MSFVNDIFISPFLIFKSLNLFLFLTLTHQLKLLKMLNRSNSRYLCLILDLSWENFQYFIIKYDVWYKSFIETIYQIKEILICL